MRFFIVFLLFLGMYSNAQISAFTFSVQKTNETCTSNATITITTQNTLAGATLTYQLFLLPDVTTPIFNNTTGVFTGLDSGNYKVAVTQSLNNQSHTKEENVLIQDQIIPLIYTLSSEPEICGNDGKITVNVTSGTATQYEIISGPMIRPLQNSNVFNALTAGQYNIRVFDTCGEGVVLTFELIKKEANLNITLTKNIISCNWLGLGFQFSATEPFVVAYPLNISITINPPTGSPVVINSVSNTNQTTVNIPFFNNLSYSYTANITDRCGNVYQNSGTILETVAPETEVEYDNCLANIKICKITSAILTAAPTGYLIPLPQNLNSLITNECLEFPDLLAGNYTFSVVDICGVLHNIPVLVEDCTKISNTQDSCNTFCMKITCVEYATITAAPASFPHPLPYQMVIVNNDAELCIPNGNYTINLKSTCKLDPETLDNNYSPGFSIPDFGVFEGCENGTGCVRIFSNANIATVSIVNAPATFTNPLPYDVSNFKILTQGTGNFNNFVMCGLVAGTYTFSVTLVCGNVYQLVVPIIGYQANSVINIERNCGSFNVALANTNNVTYTTSEFFLQKLNTTSNLWEHPITGVAYTNGSLPNTTNSLALANNATTFNIAATGTFRVIQYFQSYQSGTLAPALCLKVLNTFDYQNNPKINQVYTFSCGNNLFDVIIDAEGKNPLLYRITSKNGQPFFINNNTSNVFIGLTTGIYNFQVEDACGNILNSLHTIDTPYQFTITANQFCPSETATLSVPLFNFLNYSWYKADNPTNILSTSNLFSIANFNPTIHNGIYTVRIKYTANPNSCIDYTVSFNINISDFIPNAGTPQNQIYCGKKGMLNLFNFISGQTSNTGTWSEITNSGLLNTNSWNSDLAAFGTYQFKYRINGLCNSFSETLVSITLKPIPNTPDVSISGNLCMGNTIQISTTALANATYSWTGPNNFSSNQQNIILQNTNSSQEGIYTLKYTVDGCESLPKTIEIKLENNPEFTLKSGCDEDKYFLEAIAVNNSYNPQNGTYTWTNSNNTIFSNASKIDITGLPIGVYNLQITTPNGCFNEEKITVNRTVCTIPNGISPDDNGQNDSFDLTGFEVDLIKIFNRYGMVVYQYNNYTDQWKGQDYNGNLLPVATYYYYLKLRDGTEKTGWVYLMYQN